MIFFQKTANSSHWKRFFVNERYIFVRASFLARLLHITIL